MARKQKPPSTDFLSVRMDAEQKALVQQAAEREGLQVSSFIIMLLVRLHILPESSMAKIKRRPVPFYTALHGLLGVVNRIGGNCKQLASQLPDTDGLDQTHARLIRAAAAITDMLHGGKLPEGVNLYRLQENIAGAGYRFNEIVKSVNAGKPNPAGLPDTLAAIRYQADAITAALTGQEPGRPAPVENEAILEQAMDEMRANMRKAAAAQTNRPPKGDDT